MPRAIRPAVVSLAGTWRHHWWSLGRVAVRFFAELLVSQSQRGYTAAMSSRSMIPRNIQPWLVAGLVLFLAYLLLTRVACR
jgi:hypothetical protein